MNIVFCFVFSLCRICICCSSSVQLDVVCRFSKWAILSIIWSTIDQHPTSSSPALIDRLLFLLVPSTKCPQTWQEREKANGKNSFPLFFENSFTFERCQSETFLTSAWYENSSQVLVLVIKISVIVFGFLSW